MRGTLVVVGVLSLFLACVCLMIDPLDYRPDPWLHGMGLLAVGLLSVGVAIRGR